MECGYIHEHGQHEMGARSEIALISAGGKKEDGERKSPIMNNEHPVWNRGQRIG